MEITLLCTGVRWELQYDFRQPMDRANVLNSLRGTRNILDKIKQLPVTLTDDTLETYEFNHGLRNIKEATLVIRNMVLLPENAVFISLYARGLLRDFLAVLINIPNQPRFNEVKSDALDIAEEVTRFLTTDPDDPLWKSLVNCLESSDRAHVVRALYALTHFSTDLDNAEANRALDHMPAQSLKQIFFHTLLDLDKDVLSGALDFWYQYSLGAENVERMMGIFNFPAVIVPRLVTLLTYEGRPLKRETVLQEEKVAPPPAEMPAVPPELISALNALQEPARSSQWLRCCFTEDPECEITQIALWQAYQSRFVDQRLPGGGVLPAAEFIKNVSATFLNAQAQVINGPGAAVKFIIKGIRPLEVAHTFEGFPYLYCKWAAGNDDDSSTSLCERAFASPSELQRHVFIDHMHLQPTETSGHYNLQNASSPIHTCRWDNCTRFRESGPSSKTAMVAGHVASHLPEDRPEDAKPPLSEKRPVLQERVVRKWYYMDTPINERGEPYGIAYKAALVLRNIAWNLSKSIYGKVDHHAGSNGYYASGNNTSLKNSIFLSHRPKIIDIWDRNRSLRKELTELVMILEREDD